jgi:site-specific DNA-methyltransferase (adenine-specific)
LADAASAKLSERPKGRDRSRNVRSQVAKAHNVSERKLKQAKAVEDHSAGLYEQVKSGETTLAKAARQVEREKRARELEVKAKEAKSAGPPSWQITTGDCLPLLGALPPGSARLIFADPPYNIGVDYGEGKKADLLPAEEYLNWCGRWVTLCCRALADDGSLWVLVPDEWADYVGVMLRQHGLHRRAWIKWYETFGINNPTNFNRCSRHLFYCVKDAKRFVFNADAVRRPSDRQTKYADPRAEPGGKVWDDVWQIPRLVGTAKERLPDFPTQLPLALLLPIVGCASDPGDTVLDPFCGSGTTGEASLRLGRRFAGLEKSEAFADKARLRLLAVQGELHEAGP